MNAKKQFKAIRKNPKVAQEVIGIAWSLARQGNYHRDVLTFISGLKEFIDERALGKESDK